MLPSKTKVEKRDNGFYQRFQAEYVHHRFSGNSTRSDPRSPNRDTKNVKKIVRFLRGRSKDFERLPIEELVANVSAIRHLGDKHSGYLDTMV